MESLTCIPSELYCLGATSDFFFGLIVMAVLIHIHIGLRVANVRALFGETSMANARASHSRLFFRLVGPRFCPRPSVLIAFNQLLGGPGVPFWLHFGFHTSFFLILRIIMSPWSKHKHKPNHGSPHTDRFSSNIHTKATLIGPRGNDHEIHTFKGTLVIARMDSPVIQRFRKTIQQAA